MEVAIDDKDWKILAGMGSGAETGLEAAGIPNYQEAVAACATTASMAVAAASLSLSTAGRA